MADPILTQKETERFWSKTRVNPERVCNGTPCVEWVGGHSSRGYGRVKIHGTSYAAHRIAWVIRHGPVPAGACVLHECDNPPCLRHLVTGDQSRNIRDCVSRGRHPLRNRTSCPHGHDYSPGNTHTTAMGHRQCLACARLRAARRIATEYDKVQAERAAYRERHRAELNTKAAAYYRSKRAALLGATCVH